jgi:phenylacetaldehyde dehydrogenase
MTLSTETREFLDRPKRLLIGNEWCDSKSRRTFPVYNPATGEEIAQVAQGAAADIDIAVEAARKAFENPSYRAMTPAERARLIWKLADLIEDHIETFSELETLDNGKPLTVSRAADVPLAVELFRYMAGWVTKIEGNTIPLSVPYTPGAKYLAYTQLEPVGVVGQVIPWNFPLLMAAWKLGPALAMGCTVVLKPAEQTPLSALLLGELIVKAGFPSGVINIVPGFGEAGAALAAHPKVDKVAFTGSTEVGKLVLQAAAGNLKKVSLELGGKSPNIIFKDSDLSRAIAGAASAIFFNHGQCCCAGSRLYVEQPVFDQIAEGIAERARKIKVLSGFDPESEMGPLVSQEQLERVCGYIESGLSDGATALAGGAKRGDQGYFVDPTVFTDVSNDSRMVREEIFGPVVVVTPFRELDELLAIANDSTYGLAAGIWTSDVSKAHRLASQINAGTIWVNCYNIFDAALPFGGYKESGWGREMGHDALELYCQKKAVCLCL